MINATIGRYNILEEIDRGKTGILYRGEDPVLEREVFIKILPPTLASDAEFKERFIRESQALARLAHPSIQKIYDVSEHEGIYFVVLEPFQGKTLDQVHPKNQRLAPQDALPVLLPAWFAVDYAHQYNQIHQNLHPGNILIPQKEHAKVIGFSLSWLETEQHLANGETPASLLYFSPEQARRERMDERSDIFSLGVIFYEMLTGRLPFQADSPTDLIQAHLAAKPLSPSEINSSVPQHLGASVMKALEISPADRYQTLGEMIADVSRTIMGESAKPPQSPSDASIHNGLAGTYYKQGKMDLAILEWEKAASLDPFNALTHNNLGTAFEKIGRVQSALQEYQKAVHLNPNNFVAHYNYGSALYRLGEFDSSISEYKTVTILNPKFASAYHNMGNGYFKKGDLEEATRQWQNALANNPQLAEAIHNLGNVLWRQGKKEEAVEQWKRVLELDPNFSLASYNIGAALYQEGKVEEARAEWAKALEANPDLPELHYNLGVLAYNQANYDGAIESWQKALRAKPDYWEVLYNLGNAYYQKQIWNLAEEYWKKTLEVKSDYWQAHWNLGNLCGFYVGRPEEAVQQWQNVILLKRNHWQAYFNIGEIYFKLDKLDLAELEWQKVIALNPEYWPAYHNLGSIAYRRGETFAAIQWWAKAMALLIFG